MKFGLHVPKRFVMVLIGIPTADICKNKLDQCLRELHKCRYLSFGWGMNWHHVRSFPSWLFMTLHYVFMNYVSIDETQIFPWKRFFSKSSDQASCFDSPKSWLLLGFHYCIWSLFSYILQEITGIFWTEELHVDKPFKFKCVQYSSWLQRTSGRAQWPTLSHVWASPF